jgi:glycosyltransferase involved in cell wall biosynthesis
MKKVSVVIPAYNKAKLTVKTVESVLAQTYNNIEIIVVDDGSTDNTRERLQPFGSRILYSYKENGGACSARNVGIKLATGEYIAFIDCDDIYYPEKILKSVQLLEKNSDYGFVSTNVYFINEDDDKISEYARSNHNTTGWIASKLMESNIIANSTVVARKSCFEEVGYFDEKIFIPADWDMWLRLAERYQAGYLEEKLSGYRITGSYTMSNMEKGMKEMFYVLKKAFKRNHVVSQKVKNICYANVYFGYGIRYLAICNFKESRNLFFKALKNSCNLKTSLVFGLSLVAPKMLQKLLTMRIPRYKYIK